ncbi:integration host factor subunit alpha [Candidatus Williamhamiltonella defendens]|uniref:Integration host factor subunit alpha n=1 Tax=Candidatus Hamiltonella defensa (Bemisia tabaci) TaxID=672795 RepID=A0A249E0E8_9ENTR|nr:integration host factor subunit alpha [Candidatus Hamiltonella defensa]ASX27069.1 integration host factor subunit alpha [Candidatus Hamiltonella defensa (Bemisia tabaci)]
MTITKADILNDLSEKFGLDPKESKHILELFFEEIRSILGDKECSKLKFSGFGNFNVRNKKERPGRNPKTGKKVLITKRRVVTFHAGLKLKSLIENGNEKCSKLKNNQ